MFFGFRIASPLELRVKSAKIRENVNLTLTKSNYLWVNGARFDLVQRYTFGSSKNQERIKGGVGWVLTVFISPAAL
jgi:hypothetical protein